MKDILLVTVDSLRADHVGYHDYKRDTTPNLDSLAESGHRLTSAFANGCGTSRSFASIMSSTYPRMYGGFEPLSESRPLLSKTLQTNGYETAGFHSNPYLNKEFGYSRGFETYFSSKSESTLLGDIRQWVKDTFEESSIVFNVLKQFYDLSERTVGYNPGTPFVRASELTDRAIEWAESADTDQRFLWVHYMDVHHPYSPPEEYQREFRDDVVSTRRTVKLRRKMLEKPEEVTEDELQTLIDLYDGEIRYFDHHAARLIDAVEEVWSDDLVVAVTSDHGDEFREHGKFSHYDRFYDELIHVPLFFNTGAGSGEHEELVELLDLAPTLLDYADVPVPEEFLGKSLRPIFEGDTWPKNGICVEADSGRAYRTKRWKYIRTDTTEQLFDLEADPDERTNLAAERSEEVERFKQELQQYAEYEQRTKTAVDSVEINDEMQEQLEQLGYLE